MILCKDNGSEYEWMSNEKIQGGFNDRECNMEIENLEPGNYHLYVEMLWNDSTPKADRNFVVSSYGKSKVLWKRDDAGQYSVE